LNARVGLVACFALLLVKLLLIWRININWDEFLALTQVHALHRGELDVPIQSLYAQFFRWLPLIGGDEADQIIAARGVMVFLLAVSCVLLWKLATRWVDRASATIAPIAYLSSSYVQVHGGSFRADSLLVPLTLVVLLFMTRRPRDRHSMIWAGLFFGLALAVTIKAVLLAPVLAILFVTNGAQAPASDSASRIATNVLWFAVATVVVAATLLSLHALSLGVHAFDAFIAPVSGAAHKTLLEEPLLPRLDYFEVTLNADGLLWLALVAGAAVAMFRRKFDALACGLSLLPIVFYRNAFPYYYTVMFAPACVLAALACAELRSLWMRAGQGTVAAWVVGCIGLLFVARTADGLFALREDRQGGQRDLIAAVHQIFPKPVAYIDHGAMIASFRKANFFMSTWGLEIYRVGGSGFVQKAIERDKPPLLIVNRQMLRPGSSMFRSALLEQDQRLIRQFYMPYWGPVRIAGAEASLAPGATAAVALPFAGTYRVVAPWPLQVNGVMRSQGDIVRIDGATPVAILHRVDEIEGAGHVTLLWAAAMPAPDRPVPQEPLYDRL